MLEQEVKNKMVGVRLEDQMSWMELANLCADRIENNGFIHHDNWNRNTFINWFLKRKNLGLRFDWKLVARAYIICKQLQKEKDHFTVIVGTEGKGKSTLAIQLCSWVSPNFDVNDVVFDMKHYIDRLRLISKDYKKNKAEKINKSLQIDEGGINLFSRESLSQSNKVLAKTFMVQRFLNVHVCICIPHFWSLDTLIRNHRINTLIVIKERSYYKSFTGQGIKIINKLGSKDKEKNLWALPVPHGLWFEGNFNKSFTNNISHEDYDKHKFKHITNFLDEAKLEAESMKMFPVSKIEKEFGVTKDIFIKQIQDGELEGKKVGNKWFITQKAYEKLIKS